MKTSMDTAIARCEELEAERDDAINQLLDLAEKVRATNTHTQHCVEAGGECICAYWDAQRIVASVPRPVAAPTPASKGEREAEQRCAIAQEFYEAVKSHHDQAGTVFTDRSVMKRILADWHDDLRSAATPLPPSPAPDEPAPAPKTWPHAIDPSMAVLLGHVYREIGPMPAPVASETDVPEHDAAPVLPKYWEWEHSPGQWQLVDDTDTVRAQVCARTDAGPMWRVNNWASTAPSEWKVASSDDEAMRLCEIAVLGQGGEKA